jgi:hypothetical protein
LTANYIENGPFAIFELLTIQSLGESGVPNIGGTGSTRYTSFIEADWLDERRRSTNCRSGPFRSPTRAFGLAILGSTGMTWKNHDKNKDFSRIVFRSNSC